jgi:hypothetical protein
MVTNDMILLPDEFLEGPWITAQEVMRWLGITKQCLKTWRYRRVLAYSKIGGLIVYNKPWIYLKLKEGWIAEKPPKRKPKK